MATKALLTELVGLARAKLGVDVQMTSMGGVDAAKRVQSGEPFDLVFLASDAINKLITAGHALAGSAVDQVMSNVAMAVPAGRDKPVVNNEADLQALVSSVGRLSYSTGPSGVALAAMFERWGMLETLAPRIVIPPPGVPVARLLAQGEVDLGFQQTSEMLNVPGIELLGPLPADVAIVTTFSAAISAQCAQVELVRQLLDFWASGECDLAKRTQGMLPA